MSRARVGRWQKTRASDWRLAFQETDNVSTHSATKVVTSVLLRRLLLALFALGATGAGGDLLLIGHVEGWAQLVPLVLLALGLGAAAWLAVTSRRLVVQMFRAVMGAFVVSGGLGLWLHYRANVEFERELAPDRVGFDIFRAAITGASPPTLAPATLIHLGLLGLASTFRHPLLASTARTPLSGDV